MRAALRGNTGVAAVLVLALLAYGAFIRDSGFEQSGATWYSLFDDAMISMRYARNLAAGDGLVWNPGGEPVEGYTNFLWTMVMTAAHVAPVSPGRVSLLVMLAGAGLLAATAATAGALARRLTGSDSAAVAAAALTAFYYPLAFWTLRGMETGLQAWLLLLLAVQALRVRDGDARAPSALAVVAALALLNRPDGVIGVGIVGAGLGFALPAGRRRALAPVAAAVAGVVLFHTGFRWAYYGDPLPNTYYLKSTGVPLAERLERGTDALYEVARLHLWPLIAVLAAGEIFGRRRFLSFGPALLGFLLAGHVAYSVWVGGDAWEWMDYSNRFIAPAVPAGFVLVAVAGTVLAERLRAGGRAATALVLGTALGVGVLMNQVPVRQWLADGAFHVEADARAARFGAALRDATGPENTIAVVWAGAIPYFAERTCVDLLGKNDAVIARGPAAGRFEPGHNKWNYRHSIGELRPDVVFQTSFVWREPGFTAFLAKNGYERLPNGIWIRAGAGGVDGAALAALESPND